jgi:hypothetical protein
MKHNLLCIRNPSVPRCKHVPAGYKTNQLMTYKAKVAVCSEIRTKHSAQSEHHVELLIVRPGGTYVKKPLDFKRLNHSANRQ